MNKKGLINFRDFSNKTNIKTNMFYRGPALLKNKMSEDDYKMIDKLKFKHIIDFRSADEIEYQGEIYIPDGCNYHHLSAIVRNDRAKNDNLDTLNEKAHQIIENWLIDIYKDIPFANPTYKYMLDLVVNKETPIYINCSAGKDRTGIGAALIELLLAVDEKMIYDDYLESYHNYLKYYLDKGKNIIDINRPSLCYKEWLEGTINEIKTRYQNIEEYFDKEYQIDIKTIKELRDYYINKKV